MIASRWEVTDSSTEQLMDRFYDELDNGTSPDAALRAAKLSLLRGSAFHNPLLGAVSALHRLVIGGLPQNFRLYRSC